MKWQINVSSLFLFLTAAALSTLVDAVPPILTAFALLAVPFAIYLSLSDFSETKILALIVFAFLTSSVLTMWHGVLYGWDSWLYIGSAMLIDVQGWSPDASNNVNAHQFPGIQFTTLIVANITRTDIVSAARYLVPLLKLSPVLFSYLIVRVAGLRQRIALIGPLLLVSFAPFIAWLPYHHITYGFALKFAILYLVITTVSKYNSGLQWRLFLSLTLLLAALLVSHQFSMFQVMVLIGLTICGYACGQFFVSHRFQLQHTLIMLFIIFTVISILYYLWIGSEYFIRVLELQSSVSGSPSAQSDPNIVERRLDRLYTGGASTSTIDYWISRKGITNIIGILVFALSALVALFHLSQQVVNRARPNERDVTTFLMFGFVGIYGLFRTMSMIGIGVFGGTRRLVLSALPFAIAGSLAVKSAEEWDGLRFKATTASIVFVFLLASVAIFPGYLLTEDAIPSETEDQQNRRFLTQERQSTYEWTRHGTHTQVGTQGMLYVNGVVETTQTHVRPRVYAGDYSVVPEGTLFVVADAYKRQIPIRGHPYNYRLTNESFQRNARSEELLRVYDSGNSRIYQINER